MPDHVHAVLAHSFRKMSDPAPDDTTDNGEEDVDPPEKLKFLRVS